MRRSPTRTVAAIATLALLTACSNQSENSAGANTAQTASTPTDETIVAETETTNDEDLDVNRGESGATAELIPPAPGEIGGLPDDRTPLDERAIDPASIQGAGLVLERFAIALETGDYTTAYQSWRENGRATGMTLDQYRAANAKYVSMQVLIGKPQSGGTQTAVVPVQIYGRLAGGKPYNLRGPIVLARTGRADKPWAISDSDLKPLGSVREGDAGG